MLLAFRGVVHEKDEALAHLQRRDALLRSCAFFAASTQDLSARRRAIAAV